jgi:hypothetical protein
MFTQNARAGIRLHRFGGESVGDRAFKGEWPSRMVGKTVITFAKATDFALRKHYTGRVTSSELLLDSFLRHDVPSFRPCRRRTDVQSSSISPG